MKSKIDKLDWYRIQKEYDTGLSIEEIYIKYNFKGSVLNRARKSGLFKKRHTKLSEEHKAKISKGRKEYLKKNKGRHNWSQYKSETKPEKEFKKIISKFNIDNKIYQYYKSEEFERNYELDFAIPELKIAFEINGNQHYNKDGTLTKYYKKRHDYLVSFGWKVIEIPYLLCFDSNKIENIISSSLDGNFNISNDIINSVIDYTIIKRNKQEAKLALLEKEKILKLEAKLSNLNKLKKSILTSNIDFSKYGWVQKVSTILDITPQKVNNWMKLNMLDFYETKCFVRK